MNIESEEYYNRRSSELLAKIKPGTILKIIYGKGNRNNRKYHVLGIFDDSQIAVKYHANFNWYYKFESILSLVVSDDMKVLKIT